MNYSHRAAIALFAAIAAVPLLAQETTGSVESQSSLWNMIAQGGWAMYPLGACSLALIYLIIHCARETNASKFGSEFFSSRIESLCKAGRIEDAISAARLEPSVLGKALAAGLPKLVSSNEDSNKEKVEETIQERFDLEEHSVGQWIHYINVIATVSPMVGLLGTVNGMIGAFQTMSTGGMGRPELLAGNIGEALITTATGLCIGISAMVAHSYFNNRLNNQLVESAQRANSISEHLDADSTEEP